MNYDRVELEGVAVGDGGKHANWTPAANFKAKFHHHALPTISSLCLISLNVISYFDKTIRIFFFVPSLKTYSGTLYRC